MILIGLYFASIFVSIIYTYKKLSGPGMSKAIRMLVLKRHILTSVVYAISNIYICIAYLSITNDGWFAKLALYNQWWAKMLKIMFVLQGFFIPLVRLSEPYFFLVLKQKFYACLRCGSNKEEEIMETEADEKFMQRADSFSRVSISNSSMMSTNGI